MGRRPVKMSTVWQSSAESFFLLFAFILRYGELQKPSNASQTLIVHDYNREWVTAQRERGSGEAWRSAAWLINALYLQIVAAELLSPVRRLAVILTDFIVTFHSSDIEHLTSLKEKKNTVWAEMRIQFICESSAVVKHTQTLSALILLLSWEKQNTLDTKIVIEKKKERKKKKQVDSN